MGQLKKWMFLLVDIVSGVTELVGDGFSHDLSHNMAIDASDEGGRS
jgi:hypothetical protein